MSLKWYAKVKSFFSARRGLRGDRRGVTALEYGLIAAVMGALVVTAFTTLGTAEKTSFTTIGSILVTKTASM